MNPVANQAQHMAACIRSLIAGDIDQHALPGGVILRYRAPDAHAPRPRLLAYHLSSEPLTTGSLALIRQALESAIGQPALPAERWQHGVLSGYLLPWQPAARQGALALDMPAMPARTYQE